MTEKIDVFLPVGEGEELTVTPSFESNRMIGHLYSLGSGQIAPGSDDALRQVARRAQTAYVLLGLSPQAAQAELGPLDRMLQEAHYADASAVYADFLEKCGGKYRRHPLIDFQRGSLRTDFDFGPLLFLRVRDLNDYLQQALTYHYRHAALYDLQLYLARTHCPVHLLESFCRLPDVWTGRTPLTDETEAEQALTQHLNAVGARIDASSLLSADFNEQQFPCEASVIIPVLNREATIAEAVESALAQKTSFKFNVIVVDNHSTDSTHDILLDIARREPRLIVLTPEEDDLEIGGCWNLAINDEHCGRFAVQLDSDDIYAGPRVLQSLVDTFYQHKAAMVVGGYKVADRRGQLLSTELHSHNEWTDDNGCNNLLRMNGIGAPRAFFTPLLREVGFPNVSFGEDYAVALTLSRYYRVARTNEAVCICRRGEDNVSARRDLLTRNAHDYYKDHLRSLELDARRALVAGKPEAQPGNALTRFFNRQLDIWPEVNRRFCALAHVQQKQEGGFRVQFNPDRIVSTGAKLDKDTLEKRPCFLCQNNRPKEQRAMPLDSHFDIMINPFPVLPVHFTVVGRKHHKQNLADCAAEMYKMLVLYPELIVFYNGPRSGASAPDHIHLQAGSSFQLPLQCNWKQLCRDMETVYALSEEEYVGVPRGYVCPVFALRSKSRENFLGMLQRVVRALPKADKDDEPMMDALSWREGDAIWTLVFPRRKHRPDCYYADGERQMLVSPGTLDMAGLVIMPREEDFRRVTASDLEAIVKEVALDEESMEQAKEKLKKKTMTEGRKTLAYARQPEVTVGIVSGQKIEFSLNAPYEAKGEVISGSQVVEFSEGGILWNNSQYRELTFRPINADASFSLKDVTIGVNFHWERKETQTFRGTLRLVVEAGKICAINQLPVEEYLESVISSEMSATSSLELLKAHAVISRSWLLAQMEKRKLVKDSGNNFFSFVKKDDMLVKWYDREDHTIFDVCADDHCQRYQGITKESSPHVVEAVRQTRGQILTSEGEICDARFSKCCGGVTEEFQYCWEDTPKPYLKALADNEQPQQLPDLTDEAQAEKWIRSAPPSFCNTTDRHVLSQVLNDYDQETTDFYRWHVSYTQDELTSLVNEKLKMDFGQIIDLVPLKRGKSGRICLLKIVGTKLTFSIGKELEIRRALSKTHLYSSAFVVDRQEVGEDNVPQRFELTGAGWGHGVGLCQIGAAVMGEKGYDYKQILTHYYPGADITRLYK